MAAPVSVLKTHQDYLYKFYASLVRQRPNSKMAIAWLLKHGYDEDLLPMAYLSINPMSKKIQKSKPKPKRSVKLATTAEVDEPAEPAEPVKPVKPKKPVKKTNI